MGATMLILKKTLPFWHLICRNEAFKLVISYKVDLKIKGKLEDGTDRLSRNVGKKLPPLAT